MSGLTISGYRLCSTHVAHPPLPGRAVPGRSVAAGEFAHDERMYQHVAASETLAEFRRVFAKVVNPE